jgi:hypothetical protein
MEDKKRCPQAKLRAASVIHIAARSSTLWFPLIRVAAAAAIVTGSGALIWYSNLPAEGKESAGRRANELAYEWFGQALDKLSKLNFIRVLLAVKREMTGKNDDDPIGA